jgi:hypothetical protein
MAEAFMRTIKRDYIRVCPRPDDQTVLKQLPSWINHYNEVPYPASSSQLAKIPDRCPVLCERQHNIRPCSSSNPVKERVPP